MTDTRITGLSTTYDRDDYSRTVDYLIGDRSGGSSFRILAEEAVLGVLESVTGNVGIGTTSPSAKLDVSGTSELNGNVTIDNGAAVPMQINVSGTRRLGFFQNEGSTTYNGAIPLAIPPFDNGTGAGPRIQIGRNENASTPAAGHLLMRSHGNSAYRIWVDNSGNLRVWASGDPTNANDTSGTVVGTQTSMAAAKDIYPDLSSLADVAVRIRAGAEAVRKFAYKSGAFNGQEFEGVVVDDAPAYGMDRDDEHPAGKSLNEIQIIGDLLRMVADLSKRVAELEAK